MAKMEMVDITKSIENRLRDFECCNILSDFHYVENPVLLLCKHLICANCFVDEIQTCKKCYSLTKKEKDKSKVVLLLQNAIKNLFDDFKFLNDDYIANTKSRFTEKLKNDIIKNFEKEILQSIEISHTELDNLIKQIVKAMNIHNVCIFGRFEIIKNELNKISDAISKLNSKKLKESEIFNLYTYIKPLMMLFQEDFETFHFYHDRYKKFNFKYIKPSKDDEFKYGTILYNDYIHDLREIEIFNTINKNKFKKVNKNPVKIASMCFNPNRNLIYLNCFNTIELYDEGFNHIKKIYLPEHIIIYDMAINDKGELFMTNANAIHSDDYHICKFDIYLNTLRFTCFKREMTLKGICYQNQRFYICDTVNKQIIIVNDEEWPLKIKYDIKLKEGHPEEIRIIYNTLAIITDIKVLLLYYLSEGNFDKTQNFIYGKIINIGFYFYVVPKSGGENRLGEDSNKCYVLATNSKVVKKLVLHKDFFNGQIMCFKRNLYIYSPIQQSIFNFSFDEKTE